MNLLTLAQQAGYTPEQLKLVEQAITLANTLQKKRKAGDTQKDHNSRVAKILLEYHAELPLVLAALVKGSEQATIEEQFSTEVVNLLTGLTQLKKIKQKNATLQAEALKQLLLTTLHDVRIIILKLAQKLDNVRSLAALSGATQKRVAQEVLDVYAPLAYRLGLEKIRTELEDKACAILHPQLSKKITHYLQASQKEREEQSKQAIQEIKKVIADVSILAIKGRSKHIYSIYKKLQKGKTLEELYDLLGIRIITHTKEECYTILGLLHEHFIPLEGRFKDYIAHPKPNLYRSLHTGLRLSTGKIVEVQIRTQEMDDFAEEGFAAHWKYKGGTASAQFEKRISWLKEVLELTKESSVKEFLSAAKVDVFGDQMYCYTPKGDVRRLPKGASVLDFAYTIHEAVGNTTVGGRVNGRFVSLKHKLATGDVVEIVTNKKQRPRRSWIKIVKSAKSRQKIRKSLKEYEDLPAFHYRTLVHERQQEGEDLVFCESFPKASCTLAQCCYPLPGEPIIGILTKKRIISVHLQECKTAKREEERWLPVFWKEVLTQPLWIQVTAKERRGVLADILHTIVQASFVVKEAKAKLLGNQHTECSFQLVPESRERLEDLIKRIKKLKGIEHIRFT